MSRFIGFAWFLAIVAAAVAGHAIAIRSHGRYPSLVDAIEWLEARHWGRFVLFAGWAFGGWHFFVR